MIWFNDAFARKIRTKLGLEMRRQLLPLLAQLNFQVLRKRGVGSERDGFPLEYYRFSGDRVDAISFQWDKYGRPKFIINFDMINDSSFRNELPADVRSRWFDRLSYRAASRPTFSEKWFIVSGIAAIISSDWAIKRPVASAARRLRDVDQFMTGGMSTMYIRKLETSGLERMPKRALRIIR